MSAPAEESIERGGTSKSQPGREEQAQDLCERRKKQNREAQRRFRGGRARTALGALGLIAPRQEGS